MIYPLFISRIDGVEIVVIVLLVVLLFGAKKIPELMKGVGRGMKGFKDAMKKDYVAEDKGKEQTKSQEKLS